MGHRLTSFMLIAATVGARPVFTQEAAPGTGASPCTVSVPLRNVRSLPEGSGVDASLRSGDLLWAHNDSGRPLLHALNGQGAPLRTVLVEGASVDDWEDIAAARCGDTTCLYIADIGDNNGRRDHITIYRVPEPSDRAERTEKAQAFHATYPDGARDAEAIFVAHDGRVFIVTKGDPGEVALYRFPDALSETGRMRLERVSVRPDGTRVDARDRPTGADASTDGRWVAIRSTHWVEFHRTDTLLGGQWQPALRADLAKLEEPRGEGISLGDDGTVFLVGEGGSGGTFARLTCALPR